MKIGLLGFGTVGSAFYALSRECADAEVARLLVLEPLPQVDCPQTTDFNDILRDDAIDTVVELIGGLHPAYEYVSAALKAGKNVVTANKWLVSVYYDELIDLACRHGVSLRCTAAAGGGIPWLHSLARLRAIDRVSAVYGIMNGSTNYMLSAMTDQGIDYAAIMQQAKQLGYLEADPTADVEGYDARRKLVLSANIAFGVSIREEDVPCIGITGLEKQDIAAFQRMGLVCKLIAHAELRGETVSACVEPMLVPVSGQLAHTNGADNLITLVADRVGRQSFFGAGAGGFATGSNVLADCLEIKNGCAPFYILQKKPVSVCNTEGAQRYYLRTEAGVQALQMSVAQAHRLADEYRQARQPFFMAAVAEGDQIC